MLLSWDGVAAAVFFLAFLAALFFGVPAVQDWWSGMIDPGSPKRQRLMRHALRRHGISQHALGKPCVLSLTRHASGLADFTQQEYRSTPEWAFNRMAEPVAITVAMYKKGTIRKDATDAVIAILRQHGVEPES